MAGEGGASEGEVMHLSTPPTVGSTVEDPGKGISYPRRAREEDLGGESEGNLQEGTTRARPDAGAVDAGWAHALSSRASCQLGRCAYADPTMPRNSHFAGTGCDGYHASRHDEPDGRVTIRWGLCPRH